MKYGCVLLVSILAAGANTQVQATPAEEYQDVKCFVQTSLGDKVVFFNWPVRQVAKNTYHLVGKGLGREKGVENFVKKVTECVPMEKKFSNHLARELDKHTLK
ncbi:TapY2 family type IVa secretion system protein [Shewanella sp. 3B26]|uniref:TapY2 family type IVa secretion system protein n=1 Tax=Shewanella zhuhaiensis TaxID=2919576 RepID=A0AAJ1BEU1_9GAMM|nr:TapY2 family type IVa secretion system protein [Shewanella zhuhaiensis]MCH4293323.1 TapY2 family type IVa secretion system protein [Shewanella zhuhaiensis]